VGRIIMAGSFQSVEYVCLTIIINWPINWLIERPTYSNKQLFDQSIICTNEPPPAAASPPPRTGPLLKNNRLEPVQSNV
jgi:hypothetical protein